MLKRLTKGRRHSSADELGLQQQPSSLSPDPVQLQPAETLSHQRRNSETTLGTTPSFVFGPRGKMMARKSCGEAYTLLAEDDAPASLQPQQPETDYRVVTAMPAFIVEHEPEKQRGLSVWGLRRMSKKIDSFRRSGSRDSICTIPENNNHINDLDTVNNNKEEKKRFFQNSSSSSTTSHRSPSPFKSFFIRMGSTGMLNSAYSKSRRSSQNLDDNRAPEKENLFRSCSTSQLNTSPTYVKGDDPSEGIDLRINSRNEHGKTVSCDNLSGKQEDDVFLESPRNNGFIPCDFADPSRNDFMKKSSSCDFKEAKKTNFPYAFLRSKLSVLPEERHYNGVSANGKEERLFKVASEEHFPAMKIEESFEGTTTLGRRRPKTGYPNRESLRYRMMHDGSRSARNSYSEENHYDQPQKTGYFGTLNLAMMHSMEENCRNSISLPYQGSGQEYIQDNSSTLDLGYDSNSTVSSNLTPTSALTTLRNHRRNSAPSGEQRLSSHYVSSNESGYDSDGPRGESAEAMSLKCTDSSDTSSVVDSELEKPIRSSTPSEDPKEPKFLQDETESIDGLRWHHQSASGRLLPSIHSSSSTSSASSSTNSITKVDPLAAAHRVRLQQDKTRFLTDIIQPPKRIRRSRLVQLTKADGKESLGIRLAQQRILGELRYVIVQLETNGIAQRDGRLRLGDEIVEVEGKDLRALNTLEEVQDFLRSCEGLTVTLRTTYEESVPELYADSGNDSEYNPEDLSSLSIVEPSKATEPTKRPDYLALEGSTQSQQQPQQYTKRHVARFEKGLGKPSLGFSVVGGVDSPRGEMGIFVRRVFPGGQADVSKSLFQGDEILSLNGKVLRGCTHQEVIELFKGVREGVVELELARRHRYQKVSLKTAPY